MANGIQFVKAMIDRRLLWTKLYTVANNLVAGTVNCSIAVIRRFA